MAMVVIRLSSSILGAGVRWSSNSQIDYFPSTPRLRLVRVLTPCKAQPRHRNFGYPYRKHQARRIHLNHQPLNDANSSFVHIENTKTKVDTQEGIQECAQKSTCVDSGTEQLATDTEHNSDGSIGVPHIKETSIQFLDQPVPEDNSDEPIGVPDAKETTVQLLDHPVLDDRSLPDDYDNEVTTEPVNSGDDRAPESEQCSDPVFDAANCTHHVPNTASSGVPEAMETPIQFLDHPVLDDRSLPSYESKATALPVDFVADPAPESAQCSDPVTDTASSSVPDAMETPIQFLDHPVLDERSLLIDYDSNATQTANPALESAKSSDSITKNVKYMYAVTDPIRCHDSVTDATHYSKVVIDAVDQCQEAGSDDSAIGTEARGDVTLYDPTRMAESQNMVNDDVDKEQLKDIRFEELLDTIRDAEKNVLLLNQARLQALADVDNILKEKETLQREINMLETRLAETDAGLKVAEQDKVNAELLEDQLQKLKNETSEKDIVKYNGKGLCEIQQTPSNSDSPLIVPSSFSSFIEELKVLKEENVSLKYDLEVLKSTLANVQETDERLLKKEEERFSGITLEELEMKLAAVQENVREITSLKSEMKALSGKVEHFKALVESATRQAAEAIVVLEQNEKLWEKLDILETSAKEAKSYKFSLEQSRQYNKLLEQQVKLLEEHLLMSDKEIQLQVSLYRESVNEFHNTLEKIREESQRKNQDEPVDDMPWEFWSHLLLCLDGWLLEKKISNDDAKLLREMAWKRDARIRDVFVTCKDKQEDEAVTAFLELVSARTCPALHVVHIAAEMAPVAKVGGLGDVVSGLGKALQRRGHLVEIVLPKYDCMKYSGIENLKALNVEVESYFDGQLYKNKVWVGIIEGLPVYFIEPHHPAQFFWRGQFYGEHDDFRRFSFFCRAALEFLYRSGKKPDIIHCHDWQTAFIAPLYWDLYAPKGLNSARICFTCHNFEYQGTAPASELTSCGLDATQLNRQDRMQDNAAHHKVNAVKGGIVFSNIVTTVSPTYAEEVRTAEGGHGLHDTINKHSRKFYGILNGIDTDAWNPATDILIRFQYTADDLQEKAGNKDALRKYLGLSSTNTSMPMVGCITRLVPQKGVHLIRHSIYRTIELGGQFLLLGSSPVPHIQREFEDIASYFHGHQNVRLILKYDEILAHSIYAACDMFVIPSIFEPCGLTQMISMRYGSIPIARRTGGLNDSVFDIDDETIPLQFRNGFTFSTADEQGLNSALDRAFNYYKRSPEKWRELVIRAMNIDFSWEPSARQYEELYKRSLTRARALVRA
ncbi:unnamed protein product [Victoria cruziana]